ncbi:amidohydrolase [bacterium]|nr:amidohydrolase [candidate division CSSED10-310 bacterium]
MMTEKQIYNCHTHIFTHRHVPNRYLSLMGMPLIPVLRHRFLRRRLPRYLQMVIFWSRSDFLNRVAAFYHAAMFDRQEDCYCELASFYPPKTRFVVLPMDLAYMGAGTPLVNIDRQHEELAALAKVFPEIIPFAHIDPRRPDALRRLRTLVEEHGFKGVKIYPPLGYDPNDRVLMTEIYPYMVRNGLPLMSHCSQGGVATKDEAAESARLRTHPDRYRHVMDRFPLLRVCLGHFGGIRQWTLYFDDPTKRELTWQARIRSLIKEEGYTNLYTDISYTVFHFQDNVPLLKIFLEDPDLAPRILFGSDYYMAYNERFSEKRLSIDLRAALGERLFWKIANDNPRRYLGIDE